MARRRLDFHWNLRRLMAAHQMWKTTELVPLLRERGVELRLRRCIAWSPTSRSGCR